MSGINGGDDMAEGNFVTYNVCDERCKRLEDEDRRQNERIKKLENSVEEINRLARSTERLATSMEQMLEEQTEQGKRISKLEERDGEKWRSVVKIVATAVLSAVVGAVLMIIGLK